MNEHVLQKCRTVTSIASQTNSRPKVTQVIIWPQSFLLQRLKLQGKHLPTFMQTITKPRLKLCKCVLSYFIQLPPNIRVSFEDALETQVNLEGLVTCYFVMLNGFPLLQYLKFLCPFSHRCCVISLNNQQPEITAALQTTLPVSYSQIYKQ